MREICFLFALGFLVAIIAAPIIISIIRKMKAGQNILEYVDTHAVKQGTPTMGGIIFLLALFVCFFVIFDNNSHICSITILVTFAYAVLGFLDDFLKIKFKHNEGLKAYQKAIGQLGIALIVAIFVYNSGIGESIILPFGWGEVSIGFWIIPFVVFFYLAVTNSVNLTDGLDGLAGGTSLIFLAGIILLILKLKSPQLLTETMFVEEQNLLLLIASMCGGILAFLVYNVFPAKVFMGDTGSLALGGFIASVLALNGLYLVMLVMGVVFVVNTLSVVLQVGYFKLTRKRIFKMAPLHHHFEKCGIKENRIVYIYSVVTLFAVFVSLLIF